MTTGSEIAERALGESPARARAREPERPVFVTEHGRRARVVRAAAALCAALAALWLAGVLAGGFGLGRLPALRLPGVDRMPGLGSDKDSRERRRARAQPAARGEQRGGAPSAGRAGPDGSPNVTRTPRSRHVRQRVDSERRRAARPSASRVPRRSAPPGGGRKTGAPAAVPAPAPVPPPPAATPRRPFEPRPAPQTAPERSSRAPSSPPALEHAPVTAPGLAERPPVTERGRGETPPAPAPAPEPQPAPRRGPPNTG